MNEKALEAAIRAVENQCYDGAQARQIARDAVQAFLAALPDDVLLERLENCNGYHCPNDTAAKARDELKRLRVRCEELEAQRDEARGDAASLEWAAERVTDAESRADRYEAALREAYSSLTDSGTAYRSNCIEAEIVIRKALDGGDQ